MKKELDELLCKKYPEIFVDRHANMQMTAMCWGFDIGDGWFNIINVLCESLYNDYRQAKKNFNYLQKIVVTSGQYEKLEDKKHFINPIMLEKARLKMNEVKSNIPVASQVKEKYGSLRFYVNGATDKQYALIEMAESLSAVTCDVCGAPSHDQPQVGWIKTRCLEHS